MYGSNRQIAIFSCNDNTSHCASYTFYRMKIYGDDGLTFLRDFVPAKNASGAVGLYDNVTDTFHQNGNANSALGAGAAIQDGRFGRVLDQTGTFVPTAAKSSVYIQRGLKAQFDGIENGGRGVRDANAAKWKDLTGNGYDATKISVGVTWAANGWSNDSDGQPFALPLAFSTLMNKAVFSLDFSVKPSRKTERECFLSQWNSGGFGMEHNSGNVSSGALRFYYNGKPNLLTDSPLVIADANVSDNFIYTAKSGAHVVYKNGVQGWTSNSAIETVPETGKQFYIGGDSRGNMAFHGTYHSLRVYDRILTADEAAINSAIDQVRYCGKTVAEVNAGVMPAGWQLTDDVLLRRLVNDSLTVSAGEVVEEEILEFTNTTATATLAFSSLAASGATRTLAGEMIADGPLQIVVPTDVDAGDWTLLAAKSIEGGSITLAPECAAGCTLEKTGTQLILHVTDIKAARAVWTGDAGDGNLDNERNWSCVDRLGNAIPVAKPEAEFSCLCLAGNTSFNCPAGTTPRWNSVAFSPLTGAPAAKFGYFKRGYETKYIDPSTWSTSRSVGQFDTEFVNFPQGYMNYVGDIDMPGAFADGDWKNNYLKTSTVRIDGWFFVSAEQAGSWVATVGCDDYFGFAVDGTWFAINKTYDPRTVTGAAYDVKSGWHRYTIVLGDTFGGYSADPVKIAINGAEQVEFNGTNFTLGSAANEVCLTADCDWRGLGTLDFPAGLTINLNGYNLTIAGAKGTFRSNAATIAGEGVVTVDGGTFDSNSISVPNATLVFVNSVVATATWTGNGDRNDWNDPANWACKDVDGHLVSGGVPNAATVIEIGAETSFNLPAGQVFTNGCVRLGGDSVTLTADCDWRGFFVSGELPADFDGVRLPYLDAPKGSYINTGFAPNGDTRVVMDVTVQGTLEYWFGARYSSKYLVSEPNFCLYNDGSSVYVGYQTQNFGEGSPVPNGRHIVEMNRGNYLLDGVLKINRLHATFAKSVPSLYLFAENRANTMVQGDGQGTIRFHECWIYDNGTPVRHFVPVRKADGAVGAYDLVNGQFYYNVGTGAFSGWTAYEKETSFLPPEPVDLAGHALDLAPVAGVAARTVGDSSEGVPGTLRLHVTADQTFADTAFTLSGNMKVVVDAAGVEYQLGTKLVGLSGKPDGVTFELDPTTAEYGVSLVASNNGVFYGADPSSPVATAAHWTGAAEDGDPANPANWCATNLAGVALSDEVVVNAESDVFFHDAAAVKVPADGFAWKQLVLGGGVKLTLDATGWAGMAGDPLVTTSLGFTPVDVASRISVIANQRLDLVLSADGKSLLTVAKSTIMWRHLKKGKDWSVSADCSFRFLPLADYTTYAAPTNAFSFMIAESKNAWMDTYLQKSQNRLDGWFKVTDEQAGTWTVKQGFDDFQALAIDGDWKVMNPTYNAQKTETFEMTAGWHHFTIVFGDTGGGYGNNSGSPSSLKVTLPGASEAVPFDERTFIFEDPSAVVSGDFAVAATGEVPCVTLEVAADCRLVLDPEETHLTLVRAPSFAPGAKIALAAEYAEAISGMFTLMTWEQGEVETFGVALTDLFDTSSASGSGPYVRVLENGAGGGSLVLSLDGANDAVTAHWTGAAGDGDCANAENWACTNALGKAVQALPSEGTAVTIGGLCNMNVPVGTTLTYMSLTLGPAVTLTDDCDWRGIDFATVKMAEATIDVGNHALYLATSGDLTSAGTVTTAIEGGVLHLDVASGEVTNTGLKMTGALQFVKEGEGKLTAKCKNLPPESAAYNGGTVVAAGILSAPLSSDSVVGEWSPWSTGILGRQGSSITVQPGAMLDMNGNYDFRGFGIVLAGGTLRASGRDMANDWGCAGGLTLTADSTYLIDATIIHNGDNVTFALDGHTLNVQIANGKYWRPKKCAFTGAGKVVVTGDGGMFWNLGDIAAGDTDWDFGCKLEVKNSMTVHDFTCRHTGVWGWSNADKKVSVNGTFKPVSDYFCNVEMQDGSTLDLSDKEGVWSTTSLDKTAEGGKNYNTTFANGATVTVDVGDRKVVSDTKIIAWATAPADTVKFRLADGTPLRKKDDGLYTSSGFFFILR